MANLILPTQNATRNRTMVTRVVFVGSVVILGCALIIILGFLPAYFDVRVERDARTLVLESLTVENRDDDRTERGEVSNIRKRIDVLEKIGTPQKLTTAFEAILDERLSTITIHSFTYTHKNDEGTLNITGSAPNSAEVRSLAEALKRNILFEKVNVPLTALAHTGEGDFTLTLTGIF